MIKYFIVVQLVFGCCFNSFGQQTDTSQNAGRKSHLFEVSFGQSVLFISYTKQVQIRNEASIVVPTNAILFFSEFRPDKFIRIPVFFNLPTEPKQFIVNGQLVTEKASPTFGAGLEFLIFKSKLTPQADLHFEAGPLCSFILNKNDNFRFAPVLAGRFALRTQGNFTMYLGSSYSVGINSFGLLYGTGYLF